MNELKPGQRVFPSFHHFKNIHLTCFGCEHSHDMYDDLQYGCLMTKCRKQNDKLIPAVHPTIDCKQFSAEEGE